MLEPVRSRFQCRIALALIPAALFWLNLLGPAAEADVVRFEATDAEQAWVVPPGVTSVEVEAVGGRGGTASNPGDAPGAPTGAQGGAGAH